VSEDEARLREQPVLGVDEAGDAVVVRLGGDLDLYNAEQVRSALAGAIARQPARVVVDVSQVEFLDSTALGVLVEARKQLPEGALRLVAPQRETRRALEVSGLDRHLSVHETLDHALSAE
jgi:anti-anti-sigma factor